MASWTDEIVQFNPYVQEIPVDAYASTGMFLQDKYDRNVQKAQQMFASVKGLEVMEKHQPYLAQKTTALRNEIQKFVGADFSRNQFIDKIGASTSQVVSDPIIMGAIQSAQRIKKGYADIEKAKAEGKGYSPANASIFQMDVNRWAEDPSLENPFTGSYTPYIDVRKKLIDVAKEVAPDITLTDLPWETNPDGSVVVDANGNPVINPTMASQFKKVKEPQKLVGAMLAALDDNDMAQLGIEGRVRYAGANHGGLAATLSENYRTRADALNSYMANLKSRKAVNSADSAFQDRVDVLIDQTQQEIDSLGNALTRDIALLQSDPEAFKANFYTNNLVNSLATHLSSSEVRNEIKASPAWNAYMREKEFAHRQMVDSRTVAGGDGTPPTPPRLLTEPTDAMGIGRPTEVSFRDGLSEQMAARDSSIESLVDGIFGRDVLAEDYQKWIDSGVSVPEDGIKGYKRYRYSVLEESWKNGETIDQQYESAVENIKQQNKLIDIAQKAIDKVEKEWLTMHPETTITSSELEKVKGGSVKLVIPSSILGSEIMTVDLTAQDIVDIANYQLNKGLFAGRDNRRITEGIYNRMISKFGTEVGEKLMMEAAQNSLIGIAENLRTAGRLLASKNYKERTEFFSNRLQEIGVVGSPKSESITGAKGETRTQAKTDVLNVLSNLSKNADGREIPNQSDITSILKKQDLYNINVIYTPAGTIDPASYHLSVTGEDGKSFSTAISREQAEYLTNRQYESQLNAAVAAINVSGERRSTNMTGRPEDAFFNKDAFPHVTRSTYTLGGDIKEDLVNPGQYYLTLYLRDRENNRWITKDVPLGPQNTKKPASIFEIDTFIKKLTDPVVAQLFGQNN